MNKKALSLLLLLSILFVGAMSSCSKKDSDDDNEKKESSSGKFSESSVYKLVDKYYDGDMTEEDYEKALDMLDEYYEVLFKEGMSYVKSEKTERDFQRKMNKLQAQYYYMRELESMLAMSEPGNMGYSNSQRREDIYQKVNDYGMQLNDAMQRKYYVTASSADWADSESACVTEQVMVEDVWEEAAPVEEVMETPEPAADYYDYGIPAEEVK